MPTQGPLSPISPQQNTDFFSSEAPSPAEARLELLVLLRAHGKSLDAWGGGWGPGQAQSEVTG